MHGVANSGTATVFPEPIGLAATFDAPLIHDMAVVMGTEARAKHNQVVRAGRPLAESIGLLHGNYSGTASHATTALEGIRKQFAAAQVTFLAGMNFLQEQKAIPAAVLWTDDRQEGLKGEYFSGDNFTGTPQAVRVDKVVDLQLFHPELSALTPPSGMKDFSVRWTGFLTPAESGAYLRGLAGSMNRLWLDGQLVVDDLALLDPTPTTKTLPLEKGHWASEHADAILDAWYSGEEGGTAIAQMLAGVNNPAGRLPVTFYKSVEQLPAFEDYSMKNRTYRYFEGQPL